MRYRFADWTLWCHHKYYMFAHILSFLSETCWQNATFVTFDFRRGGVTHFRFHVRFGWKFKLTGKKWATTTTTTTEIKNQIVLANWIKCMRNGRIFRLSKDSYRLIFEKSSSLQWIFASHLLHSFIHNVFHSVPITSSNESKWVSTEIFPHRKKHQCWSDIHVWWGETTVAGAHKSIYV